MQIEKPSRAVNLAQVVLTQRQKISETFFKAGDAAALAAVACGSIVLQYYVESGSLTSSALDDLKETCNNLGLARRLGDDVVETALCAGSAFYDELDEVLAERPNVRAAA